MTDYERILTRAGLLPDLRLSLIELSGEDALEWLQGQVTNDLRAVQPGERKSFCLCKPTGQIEAVCDCWVVEGKVLIATDQEAAQALLKRVETMVILEEVQARDMTDGYDLRSIQGVESERGLSSLGDLSNSIVLPSDRLSWGGFDVWAPKGSVAKTERISEETYEVLRIEAGVPKRGVDYNERTLPPELGAAFEARYVNYTKGCYVGQEVLMRIHSRGHTNKTWVGLQMPLPVERGDEVRAAPDGEVIGRISSAAVSPALGPIAAATLRNERANEGADVFVRGIRGIVRNLPFI